MQETRDVKPSLRALPGESTITRKVGIEIEMMTPRRTLIDPITAAGGDCVSDGSIDGEGFGMEVRTAPITGNAAEDTVRAICAELREQEAFTNTSTGLHVHVDAPEVSITKNVAYFNPEGRTSLAEDEILFYVPTALIPITSGRREGNFVELEIANMIETTDTRRVHGPYGLGFTLYTYEMQAFETSSADGEPILPRNKYNQYSTFRVNRTRVRSMRVKLYDAIRFFSAIDTTLRSLVPSSRRHNTYCRPLEKVVRLGGECPETLREVLKAPSRYCGINLTALNKHGTIECRYHGGTVNADKIIHWARLWEACVRVALSRTAGEESDALSEVVNGKNRFDMLMALLALPDSTKAYLTDRYSAFTGSDARHAISYINRKLAQSVCAE